MKTNTNYRNLQEQYLFKNISDRAEAYLAQHPDQRLLRMGVGDVTRPLPSAICEAMHRAVEELSHAETFRGYGPEEGYLWLRQTIIDNDYAPRNIDLTTDEVFISEGAGSDLGNLSELFAKDNHVAIIEPTYPAYADASIMAGREITFLPCHAENGFVPDLPKRRADIIYLCFPNNPTGTVLTRDELAKWVNYARENRSIIIYDAAYESFITQPNIPHSIYEIEGAKEVAIEVKSYSKSAGFTGVRCGYTVVPKQTGLQPMWLRRQCTKYNGTSYIAQQAALATYTPEGHAGIRANIDFYLTTAHLIKDRLQHMGYEVYGGENAPYIWCRAPHGWNSWTFFDHLLNDCQILCTPGVGFGASGEGFVRFSAFSNRQDCEEALKRIQTLA
ncbi:MAG: LL-diaminopimelate aminotransferase [Paludibacteraceae bacterium]|nr:LL-diaminopimelate aminotransferase [Paludibacteraceae bacterium]